MDRVNEFLYKARYVLGFIAVAAVSAALAVYYRGQGASALSGVYPKIAKIFTAVIIICAVMSAASYVIIVWLRKNCLQTYIIFSFIAAVIFSIVIPPNTAPDEWVHFKNANYYANIILGKSELNEDDAILLRSCDEIKGSSQISAQTYNDYYTNTTFFNKQAKDDFSPFKKQIVTYTPVYVYAPQITAVTLSRLLNFSSVTTYYFARCLNLLLYFLLLWLAVKRMPFKKNALAFIGTFPILLQQAMSLSSDVFIMGMALLTFAYAMHFLYGEKKIGMKDLVSLLVLSVLLAPCKLIYFAVPLIAVFTRKDRFENAKLSKLARWLLPTLTLLSLVVLQFGNIASHVDDDGTGSYVSDLPMYTIGMVFTDTPKFFTMMMNSLADSGFFYISSMMCSYFGSIQLAVPGAVTVIYAIMLFAVLLPERSKQKTLPASSPVERIAAIAIISGTVLLSFVSMLTAWTPITFDYINGVQGRYFLPALPLIIILFMTKRISVSKQLSEIILFASNALTFYILMCIFAGGCTAVTG